MTQTRNSLFYIHYAGMQCAVQAPEEWRKYFRKLYERSEIMTYSEQSSRTRINASLVIQVTESEDIYLHFRNAYSPKKEFVIKASNAPLFLFPSVHQCVSRIFNILFHISGGFVLHSSCILIENTAILFVGEPGRGKSTIVDALQAHIPSSCIISDNSAFIKKGSSKYVVYPSPYLETNRLSSLQRSLPSGAPYEIGAIFFPYQTTSDFISPLPFEDKIRLLQTNSHIPFRADTLLSSKKIRNLGNVIFNLVRSVDMYKIGLVKNTSFIYDIPAYVRKNRDNI